MDKDKLFDYLEFQIVRHHKNISISYLNVLTDALRENAVITPEKFQIIRKRVLDTMNDAVRETERSMDKIREIF